MSDLKIDPSITWEDGVGTVNASAFSEGLPKGLKEDAFEKVDNYREDFAAAACNNMLDESVQFFEENPEADQMSIATTNLGGNSTLSASLANDGAMVASVTTICEGSLDDALRRADTMVKTAIEGTEE